MAQNGAQGIVEQEKSLEVGPRTTADEESCLSVASDEVQQLPADIMKQDFMVKFDGDNDPDNPHSMGTARKGLITAVICASSLCVTVNSTLYTFTYDQIMPLFGISREVATLGLTFFVVGLAIGPMFLAPLSEFYGRRPIYICAYTMVFIWIIPCAVAKNIQTIIVTRFIDGIFASAFLSVAGGTIGDIYNKQDLSLPMMIYSGSPFVASGLGPLIGGFLNYYANWRWSFWLLLIWTGVQLALIAAFVPETYHPVKLRQKAQRLRKQTGNDAWQAPIEIMSKSKIKTVLLSCYRPFMLLTLEPMCLNLCILSALLLGIIYLFFGAFIVVFRTNHGFNLWQIGLAFSGILCGMMAGFASNPIWKRNYQRLVEKYEQETGRPGASEPEFRLPPTVFGAWFCVAGLFGFAWTTQASIHWIAPIALSSLFGFGVVTCYAGVFTFLVEAYPLYAASALAANSFARSVLAAVFPLFGVQMYNKLGFQWASSLLAFLMLALAPFPYIFFKKGRQIRGVSRFASGD